MEERRNCLNVTEGWSERTENPCELEEGWVEMAREAEESWLGQEEVFVGGRRQVNGRQNGSLHSYGCVVVLGF